MKWSLDYTLCAACQKKKKVGQYCPVCQKVWSHDDDEPMIECKCGKWIHKTCDITLTDTVFITFEQVIDSSYDQLIISRLTKHISAPFVDKQSVINLFSK